MTDTTTQPEAPIKKPSKSKILAIISAVLILLLGTNHLYFRVGYTDVDVAINDSTIVVTPTVDTANVDTAKAIAPVIDTTKKVVADTSSKKVEAKK